VRLATRTKRRYFFFFLVAFLPAFLTAFLIFFLAAMRNLLRSYYDPDRRSRSHARDLTEDCHSLHENIQAGLDCNPTHTLPMPRSHSRGAPPRR
jgi:hypothetical protein